MGFNSQAGQVGFGVQSVKGTPVAATRFARLRGGSLGGARELLIPDPEIGGHRDIPAAYLGGISYAGDLEFYARMEMLAVLMYGVLGTKANGTPSATANEVQTITITGTPTGGTFRLTYRGQTTTPIAHSAAGAAVDTALEALSTVGAGNVAVTGGPGPGTPYIATFGGTLAGQNIAQMTASHAFTGGTNPAIAVTTTTPGSPAITLHTLTPGNTIPWLSVEERIGTSLESFRYTDAKVNSLSLEVDANGFLMGSASLLALTQLADFTEQVTPAIDTTPMLVGSQVFCYFNGLQLPAKSFNFEVNNNIEDDDFRLGSITLGDLVPKQREVSIGVTIRPDDSDLWKAATYGDIALTGPRGGPAYQGDMRIVASTYENIGATATPFVFEMLFPAVVMSPFKYEPSGDDIIEHDVEIRAIRPDPLVPIVTVNITNGLADVT